MQMQMPPCQIQKQASSKLGVLYWLAVWSSGEVWQLPYPRMPIRSNRLPLPLPDGHQRVAVSSLHP